MIEIIDIMRDAVSEISKDLEIVYTNNGKSEIISGVNVSYVFGSDQYIKDVLDIYSKSDKMDQKFPLIALFTPIEEERGTERHLSESKVSVIIACSSTESFTNEQREVYSFKNILRPIYRKLLEVLKADRRLDFGYGDKVKHTYSENYDYGRYGAYTASGDAVSEHIDAINIRSLELNINYPNCR